MGILLLSALYIAKAACILFRCNGRRRPGPCGCGDPSQSGVPIPEDEASNDTSSYENENKLRPAADTSNPALKKYLANPWISPRLAYEHNGMNDTQQILNDTSCTPFQSSEFDEAQSSEHTTNDKVPSNAPASGSIAMAVNFPCENGLEPLAPPGGHGCAGYSTNNKDNSLNGSFLCVSELRMNALFTNCEPVH